MAAYRFVTLTCDACGEIWDNGYEARIPSARRLARVRDGWTMPGTNTDLCDACSGSRVIG